MVKMVVMSAKYSLEHMREQDPRAYEFKLLLAENLGSKWLWACNASFEHEVEFAIGRKIAWQFLGHAELKLAALIGVTSHRPAWKSRS
jgi:hypothetical protein